MLFALVTRHFKCKDTLTGLSLFRENEECGVAYHKCRNFILFEYQTSNRK